MTEAAHEIRVQPFDQHNRKLVENVHPAGWTNPTPPPRYNLVAVGAGTGRISMHAQRRPAVRPGQLDRPS